MEESHLNKVTKAPRDVLRRSRPRPFRKPLNNLRHHRQQFPRSLFQLEITFFQKLHRSIFLQSCRILLRQPGHHHHWNRLRQKVLFQRDQHLGTTHLRQQHIQQNQIRQLLPCQQQRFVAVSRTANFIPRPRQCPLRRQSQKLAVLDQQNLSHRSNPSSFESRFVGAASQNPKSGRFSRPSISSYRQMSNEHQTRRDTPPQSESLLRLAKRSVSNRSPGSTAQARQHPAATQPCSALLPEDLFHRRYQRIRPTPQHQVRLLEEPGSPIFLQRLGILLRQAGQHHHRNPRRLRILFQSLQHLRPADQRNHDVQQHQRRQVLARQPQSFFPVSGAQDFIARLAQRLLRRHSQELAVFHQQHLHRGIHPFLDNFVVSVCASPLRILAQPSFIGFASASDWRV